MHCALSSQDSTGRLRVKSVTRALDGLVKSQPHRALAWVSELISQSTFSLVSKVGAVMTAMRCEDSMRWDWEWLYQCQLPNDGSEILGVIPTLVVWLHIQNARERSLAIESNDGDASPKSPPSYVTEALSLSQLPHFLICEKGVTIPTHF